jgi:hypothetical protein
MLAYLLRGNRLLAGFVELFNSLLVITQVLLTANKDNWETTAEMQDFGDPLRLSTCQRMLIFQIGFVGIGEMLPSLARYRGNPGSRQQSR